MTYRTRNILTASGLALVAVVFIFLYMSKVRHQADVGKQLVSVFVAAHNIDEGTPGATLSNGGLVEKRVPRKAVVPGAISSPTQLVGQIATQSTLADEQVSTRRFGPLAESGVRSQVQKTERVFQIAGDPNQVLDGTLKDGDRVDIVASWTAPEGCSTCHVSRTIARNILVLKTSADLGTPSTTTNGSTLVPVQLRLTDAQVEKMLWIAQYGKWQLDLRPVVKPDDSRQGYANSPNILRDGLRRNGPSQ
jgi:Flp pilus assembly protein CpaB